MLGFITECIRSHHQIFNSASRNKVEPTNELRSMYYQNFENNSTRHGIFNENHVLNLYKNFLSSQGINVTISQVGLILSKTHPFLGAYSDAFVTENYNSSDMM